MFNHQISRKRCLSKFEKRLNNHKWQKLEMNETDLTNVRSFGHERVRMRLSNTARGVYMLSRAPMQSVNQTLHNVQHFHTCIERLQTRGGYIPGIK